MAGHVSGAYRDSRCTLTLRIPSQAQTISRGTQLRRNSVSWWVLVCVSYASTGIDVSDDYGRLNSPLPRWKTEIAVVTACSLDRIDRTRNSIFKVSPIANLLGFW